MSYLSDYEQRTSWKHEPISGDFHTHEGLARKVGPKGEFLPFPGSTVVFRPEKACLQSVLWLQCRLYSRLDEKGVLAEPLPFSMIHMTLHDLISPETCASDPTDREQYAREAAGSLRRAAEIVEEIRRDHAGEKIAMVPDRIVNMVSKSLVLLLRPQTEQDFGLLMKMYRRFDCIRAFPQLTPHITLAYFRPGMLYGSVLREAVDYAQGSPEMSKVFHFSAEALTAQFFSDMQHYTDIPERVCFCCDSGAHLSVMAASIVNHLAEERHLPVICEARAACTPESGRPVPEQVWTTLEKHGIRPDRTCLAGRDLDEGDYARFSRFAELGGTAGERFARLLVPEEKTYSVGRFFYDVRDPGCAEVGYEDAYEQLLERARRYLDAFEAEYREHITG